ncbi:Uncharacterised protein [Mycobacteroides abscessus subsp. abscessus]|nr:Uncharacterised protein [Mycobacteroides abscessus subsp. abscessus]
MARSRSDRADAARVRLRHARKIVENAPRSASCRAISLPIPDLCNRPSTRSPNRCTPSS